MNKSIRYAFTLVFTGVIAVSFPSAVFANNPSPIASCPNNATVITRNGTQQCVFNADLSNVPRNTRYAADMITADKLCALSNSNAIYYSSRELRFDSPNDNFIVRWNASANTWERIGAERFNHGLINLVCTMPVAGGSNPQQYQPLSVTCSADRSAINAGDRIRWTAYATGGVPSSYRFSWTGTDNNPAQTGASNFIDYAYYQGGAKQVTVTVASDGVSSITHSCSTNVSVNDQNPAQTTSPLGGNCFASARNANVGQTIDWISSVSGGTGSYSYQWSGADGLSGTGATVSKSYGFGGNKFATVVITSGNQTITRGCDVVYVYETNYNNPPYYNQPSSLQVSCAPSSASVSVSDTVTWTSSVFGGTGSYQYFWSGTDGLFGSGNAAYRAYPSPGVKTATLTVTSGGQSVTRSCVPSVYINDTGFNNGNFYNNPLSVSCYGNPSAANVGQSVTWYSAVSGGTGFYTYYWRGNDGISGSSANLTYVYPSAGSKSMNLTVVSGNQTITRDCGNAVQIGAASVQQSLQASCFADTVSVRPGSGLSWVGIVSGGTGSYGYSWSGTDGLSGATRVVPITYASLGRKYATIVVTSGLETVTRACTNSALVSAPAVSVAAPVVRAPVVRPVAVLSLDGSCLVDVASSETGDVVLWQASSTGGNGTVAYSWSGSEGLSGTGERIMKKYESSGGKMAYVTIVSGAQSIIRPCLNGVAVAEGKTSLLASSAFSLNGPFGIFLIIILLILLGVIFSIYQRYKHKNAE